MIVLDEQLQGLGLEEAVARWYRGAVFVVNKLRPGMVINPTTPLSLALCLSALPMREIRLVIAPLDPGHEGEDLVNAIPPPG
jgi:hypothetical protein